MNKKQKIMIQFKILIKTTIVFLMTIFFETNNIQANNIWGPTGHRVTGKIAQKYLTKRAKKQIDKLLNGQSLAFVSTYADQIKSDKKYNSFYSWHYINTVSYTHLTLPTIYSV